MAKKTKNKSEYKDIVITEQKITDTLEVNYMPYAMSVIAVSYTHLPVTAHHIAIYPASLPIISTTEHLSCCLLYTSRCV